MFMLDEKRCGAVNCIRESNTLSSAAQPTTSAVAHKHLAEARVGVDSAN
jgi:hypothetical protein